MKRFLLLALGAACSTPHVTRLRSGWNSCHPGDDNAITCNGEKVAQVECFRPGDEQCGALAVHYADGERVFLYRPEGFEPGHESDVGDAGVLRPEIASDASMIWYKLATSRSGDWQIFEPQTGVVRAVDAFRIFQIRERDPHSLPLWVAKGAQ